VWGGARRIQLIYHHGTAVNLQDRRLHLARWWADDMPTQPWIVEWRHEGLPVTITSGREAPWRTSNAKSLVGFAHHAINNNVEAHSLWRLGEEYAIPEMVATKPGLWQARIVRSGSAPVAVSFSVLPGGGLANLSGRLIYRRGGWRDVVSAPLRLESVPDAGVLQLVDRLPSVEGAQAFHHADSIQLTPNAVRALFRSNQLASSWATFLELDAKRKRQVEARQRALRPQIEQLIRSQGGPWQPQEIPRS
jgi:hypothetical protein